MCWTPETRQTFRPRTMRACCLRRECDDASELLGREKASLSYYPLHLGGPRRDSGMGFSVKQDTVQCRFEFTLVREVKC